MDEDLEKFLKALESAPDHPISGYMELDGFSNAFDYLTRAEQFLRKPEDTFQFKWVTICLSNALYGFMICVLGEGNPDNVTAWPPELERELQGLAKVGSDDAFLEGLRLRDEYRRDNRTKVITFERVLRRLRKAGRLGPGGAPIPFELSSKQVNDVLKLRREYRDYFEHYMPMTWAIEEAVFLELFESCNTVIREVVSDFHLRWMHREDTKSLDATIDRIDDLLREHRERLK